ncbi:OLC1v1028089C1 [Oldenlandia corymbosa var. corymbosa]|uniref:Glycerol-3-phosphate acyltransferase RAM2 n=1 Tax=Oldenlandia corymbosa var. corymbosa TaxID=529605 RepID=A0AAV1CDZ5_OLDCO|nr:OLC1v1028089C1 [Oldenlandia corymbosa var. corymbosa]
MMTSTFPTVDKCASIGREKDTVVADMDGTLLRGRSSFPYFALIAFEVGGLLRLLFLILMAPIAGLLYYFVSESAGIQVLIFATFAGARVCDIESVGRAVLPKFYSTDLHSEAWRVFSSCGKRCVLTANPRIMVEGFLKDFLGADLVMGTEIGTYKGRATGLVNKPGVLVGKNKADALTKNFRDCQPEIGLGDRHTDIPFMTLCKEGYIVPPKPEVKAVTNDKLPKPIVFHDGRLVQKPTPLMALLTILWIPIGFPLACLRIAAGSLLPMPLVYYAFWALGVRVYVKGTPPPPNRMSMFHGTTARGWKGMDPFYFFMNPSPAYEVTFLNKLPVELTCKSGKSSHEVANYIQRVIASTLAYECTSFTRKDKYRALAGNDGTVVDKPRIKANKIMGC